MKHGAENGNPGGGKTSPRLPANRRAFTLLELMVSSVIFLLILALVTSIMSGASSLWLRHRSQAAAFESARSAFDTITRSLAQAVLNTYWEVQSGGYGRASELHFVMGPSPEILGQSDPATWPGDSVFFQASLGRPADSALKRLPLLLNGSGYFVRFDDGPPVPSFLEPFTETRNRYRLYEWLQPTERLTVYEPNDATPSGQRAWFRDEVAAMSSTAVLAENVIGLILLAEYPDSGGGIVPTFDYDSRDASSPGSLHQLPPRLRVIMAVLDEPSARSLADRYGATPPPVFPDASWFRDPARLDDDLDRWEDRLRAISPKIAYRIFTATVSIQNAKWSL